MNHTHPYAIVSAAQKVLWLAELRSLMQSDPVLIAYTNMIDSALFFSDKLRAECLVGIGEPQLIAYRDPVQPKYVIVVFQVLKQHGEIGTTQIDHAMVEITLYAQASQINDEPYVNFVVSPEAHKPVVFLSHTSSSGSATLTTTTIGLNDLLDQFPRQVENLLTQMSFITDVMQDAKSTTAKNPPCP